MSPVAPITRAADAQRAFASLQTGVTTPIATEIARGVAEMSRSAAAYAVQQVNLQRDAEAQEALLGSRQEILAGLLEAQQSETPEGMIEAFDTRIERAHERVGEISDPRRRLAAQGQIQALGLSARFNVQARHYELQKDRALDSSMAAINDAARAAALAPNPASIEAARGMVDQEILRLQELGFLGDATALRQKLLSGVDEVIARSLIGRHQFDLAADFIESSEDLTPELAGALRAVAREGKQVDYGNTL
jgi:hypothetical protein